MKHKGWEEVLKKPKAYSFHSADYPWLFRFEGLCDCDDGFFCEHRQKFVIEAHNAELQKQKEELLAEKTKKYYQTAVSGDGTGIISEKAFKEILRIK